MLKTKKIKTIDQVNIEKEFFSEYKIVFQSKGYDGENKGSHANFY